MECREGKKYILLFCRKNKIQPSDRKDAILYYYDGMYMLA